MRLVAGCAVWLLFTVTAGAVDLTGQVLIDGQTRLAVVAAASDGGRLRRLPQDAQQITTALQGAGFQTELLEDPTTGDMEGALADLRAAAPDVALVYYLGTLGRGGVQVGLEGADRVTVTMDVARLIEAVDSAGLVGLVVLDVPWSDQAVDADVLLAHTGALLDAAADVQVLATEAEPIGDNYPSPLAASVSYGLTQTAATLGDAIDLIANRLRYTTHNEVGLLQTGSAAALDFIVLPVSPTGRAPRIEQAFWEQIRQSDAPADFEAYLAAYPDGWFAAEARARLHALTGRQ
ncbi:MAG: caspase family protein [Rhodospirillaceae bacterium]|nr:caspase family protein [Rhodospirillaceae bacterium]